MKRDDLRLVIPGDIHRLLRDGTQYEPLRLRQAAA
jgi:hypothetical protein